MFRRRRRWRRWRAKDSRRDARGCCRSSRRSGRCSMRGWVRPRRVSRCRAPAPSSRRPAVSRSLRRNIVAVGVVAVGVAALAAVAGCKRSTGDEAETLKPKVKVVAVAEARIAPRTPVAGVLAPLPGRDVKVGALVPGRVDRVFVAEGDAVKVGQPLAHVEAEPLKQNVSQAAAQREHAVADLQNARTKLERAERLYRDGIAAKQEVDDARAAVVAADSGLKSAQATGGIAGVQLERATLRAPIAGVVAAILVP